MVIVVGAGFAGVEVVAKLARNGVATQLYEMRPTRMTPAHTTDYFAELVCSNSLKSKSPDSPAGLLKGEMAALDSIVLETAYQHETPAGQALGVDRNAFGAALTAKLSAMPNVDIRREAFGPDDLDAALARGDTVVLATGPLTTPELADWLARSTGRERLYFFDAVSPTVEASSIDLSVAFAQSRYDKGDDDGYLNCPFNREEYEAFVEALVSAERAPIHAFEAGGVRTEPTAAEGYAVAGDATTEANFLEKIQYFAGCMPIEAIAERGARSLAFGNFKPVGLTDPRTGRRPYAALQLRPENKEKSLYSLVACQTRLKWGEQKRVFQMAPGLQNAEFARYGVIHRNTYLDAPNCLTPELELKAAPNVFVSGQLTGVEGYVESAAMGLIVGEVLLARHHGKPFPQPPRDSALGALMGHLQDETERDFAPMNINWGLLPDPIPHLKDKGARRQAKLTNARAAFDAWLEALRR